MAPLTPSTVTRQDDAAGDAIKTFQDGAGSEIQAVALVDGNGDHIITLPISAASLPLPSGAATETTLAAVQAAGVLAGYGTNDVETSGAVTYVGKTDKDAAWLVMKIDTSSGTSIRYATVLNNGATPDYATAWTNRASLTYGTYDEAFN